MNYYRRYSGDYLRKTPTLTLTDHGAYCLLLDYYYTAETPLPLDHDELYTMVRALRPEDRKSVDRVLKKFFEKREDGYHNKRADEEIGIAKKARDNGKKGGRPITGDVTGKVTEPITEKVTSEVTRIETTDVTEEGGGSVHPLASNHQPLTSNPQPLTPSRQPPTSKKGNGVAAGPSATAATWEAYSTAYVNRYNTEPVRNAKVNSQLADFCKRISQDEAPLVAAFYLTHNNPYYVRDRHSVGSLLKDAEGLRTQWATGVKATGLEARSAEQIDAAQAQLKRLTGGV